jgi:hypothetical protein
MLKRFLEWGNRDISIGDFIGVAFFFLLDYHGALSIPLGYL